VLKTYCIFPYSCCKIPNMSLHLRIVTPEQVIFDGEADQVNVSSAEGELGILPHHANLMAKLLPGELRIKKGSSLQVLATGDGFLEVSNNEATILTDLAIEDKDIDEKAAEEAKKRAEQALSQPLPEGASYAETFATLQKAIAQLKVKRRHRVR
jgi:F-type H+-transporting ATPase subunit epsilon